MKKIWKIRKDTKAVSPVIATILMVAITVVLAAVLYVMVMGFGGGETQTPTGSFTSVNKINSTAYKITFGAVTPSTNFDECRLAINGSADTTHDLGDVLGDVDDSQSILVGSATVNYYAVDLGGDGKISVGDYIVLWTTENEGFWASGTEYTVNLIFIETGGSIAEKTFTAT